MAVMIAGVKITPITLAALHQYIASCIQSNARVPIFYANIHGINLAQHDQSFRTILNAAPIVFCDGFGVRIGAQLIGHTIPERFTPPDWIDSLADMCVSHEWSMFFLGAQDGVAAQAATTLQARHPGLRIGVHHGYFKKTGVEDQAVCAIINEFKPDILLVGFGMPIQEQWIAGHLDQLDVRVAISVGALFDYLAGTVRRGPRWLTDHGFEWLARLLIEPRRLWRRYLLGNPYFLTLIVRQWWRERWRHDV